MLVAARPATSRDGKVIGMDLETVSGLRGLGQFREYFAWGFDGGTAVLAYQVAVGEGCQVVGGGAVGQMSVHYHAYSFELVEIAVDGGQVDIGRIGLDLGRDLFRSAVPGVSNKACSSSRRELVTRPPRARKMARTSSTVPTLSVAWAGFTAFVTVTVRVSISCGQVDRRVKRQAALPAMTS